MAMRVPFGPTDAHMVYEGEYARSGKPLVRGVGRVENEPRAVMVLLTTIPTDDQIIEIDKFLQDFRAR